MDALDYDKEITRLSALCDKWNTECDEMREDNKRLAKELEVAKAEIARLNKGWADSNLALFKQGKELTELERQLEKEKK